MPNLLLATTNNNKLSRIRQLLPNWKILSLADINIKTTDPDETLSTCEGIAAQKALGYYDQLEGEFIVLTQDDTLQFIGVTIEDNPGTSIKTPVIKAFKNFNDKLALKYYTALVDKYGKPIDMVFEYGHAIAFQSTSGFTIVSSKSSLRARMVNEVKHPEKVPGYFMSAMMEVLVGDNWVHYMDLTPEQKIKSDADLKRSLEYLTSKLSS